MTTTDVTRRQLAEVFGSDPHGPVHVIDMGTFRHYVCAMCETGAATTRPSQARAFLGAHQVAPDADWLARIDRARRQLAAAGVPA